MHPASTPGVGPVSAADLDLMCQIDKLHTKFPFSGARMPSGHVAPVQPRKTQQPYDEQNNESYETPTQHRVHH
jgi:hypothetical protein